MPRTSKKLQANPATRIGVYFLSSNCPERLYERHPIYKTFAEAWRIYSKRLSLCRQARIVGHSSPVPLLFRVFVPPRDIERVRPKGSREKVFVLKRSAPGPYRQISEEDFQILKFEEAMRTGQQPFEDL